MLTIIIIDKYPILRQGLDFFLKDHFKEARILDSDSIINFQKLHPDQSPDIIILGIDENPVTPTLDFVEMSKNWYPKSNIIIFDDRTNDLKTARTLAINALYNYNSTIEISADNALCYTSLTDPYLKAGVNGYLSKQTSISQLIGCIEAVLKGDVMYIQ